jgi:hypothetical protein
MNFQRTRPVRPAPPKAGRFGVSIIARLAKQTKFVDPALAARWSEIAGEEIATLCRPGRMTGARQDRTLEIRAYSGAAATQLQMLAETLLARVNAYLGPGAVSRIAIRQAQSARPREKAPDGALDAALSSFRAAVEHKNPQD